MYVLIGVVLLNLAAGAGAPSVPPVKQSVVMHDFSSKAKCENAGKKLLAVESKALMKKMPLGYNIKWAVSTACVPK